MFENTFFPKAQRIWYMGKLYDWSEATVHSMTHALHYGTSVFEGIRAYHTESGPAIFRLDEHIERFYHSASILKMKVPFGKEEIISAIKLIVRENKLKSAYIRPLLFYSFGNLGLIPEASPVEVVIGSWEWGTVFGDKARIGVHAFIVPWRRVHYSQFDMDAKLGGTYVQSTICGKEARSQGFDEAVFLNLEGNVAEGSGANIFIVKDEILRTNNKKESILEGITRTSILEIAKDLGIDYSVGPITKEDFFHADEAFFSGTAVEIVPIIRITDNSNPKAPKKEYTIGSGQAGAFTQKLAKSFKDVVSGKIKKYEEWLSYVYD